jgi:hypothetical protein
MASLTTEYAPDREFPQRLGDASNLRGALNDMLSNWLRAAKESVEGKPNFDYMQSRQP